jgi:hypothetical protein
VYRLRETLLKSATRRKTCSACRFVSLCDDILNRRCEEENLRKMRQTAMIDDSFQLMTNEEMR